MQEAVPTGIGAMSAIIGLDADVIAGICDKIDEVSVANYNCPGQIVITGKKEAVEKANEELLALREQAYRLAKARYEQGLASARDVYETGAELYCITEGSKVVCPTLEELRAMRMTLLRSAKATGNRAEVLKTEIIWYRNVEMILTDIVRRYGEELLKLSREQYQQGLITYWEFKQVELIRLNVTSEEQFETYTAELYKKIEANAAATGRNDYRITELLFLARCRLVEYKKWAELST